MFVSILSTPVVLLHRRKTVGSTVITNASIPLDLKPNVPNSFETDDTVQGAVVEAGVESAIHRRKSRVAVGNMWDALGKAHWSETDDITSSPKPDIVQPSTVLSSESIILPVPPVQAASAVQIAVQKSTSHSSAEHVHRTISYTGHSGHSSLPNHVGRYIPVIASSNDSLIFPGLTAAEEARVFVIFAAFASTNSTATALAYSFAQHTAAIEHALELDGTKFVRLFKGIRSILWES